MANLAKEIEALQKEIEMGRPGFGADFSVEKHSFQLESQSYLVEMLQLHLPEARQTHEILFMPRSKTCSDALFVTQLSESILIRIGLKDGKLDHRYLQYWSFGPESKEANRNGVYCGCCEPHNLTQSRENPECFYLSLQVPNVIYLMDSTQWNKGKKFIRGMTIPPTRYGQYGTPHVVREHPQTGDLWIGMKGGRGANPAGIRHQVCECCDDAALTKHYDEFYRGQQKVPVKFGVCKTKPGFPRELSDIEATIFECEDSPPMLDFLKNYVYVSQDRTGAICRIDQEGTVDQMPVVFPDGSASKTKRRSKMKRDFTGPGLVATPGGEAAWCALLGHQASMVRIDAECHTFQTYHFPELLCHQLSGDDQGRGLRFIHFAFHDTLPKMYILSSSLLEPDTDGGWVADAVVIVQFEDAKWRDPIGLEVVPLPTQQSQAHRIVHVCIDGVRSLFVTEFTTSAIVQILEPEKIPLRKVSVSEASSPTTFTVASTAAATQAHHCTADIHADDTMMWAWGDAETICCLNPMHWSSEKTPMKTVAELYDFQKKHASRPVNVKIRRTGADVKSFRFRTVAEAMEALALQAISQVLGPNWESRTDITLNDTTIIWDEEAKAIAAALPRCASLQNIHLRSNRMGAERAKTICEVLPKCTSLKNLSLADNKIGGGGAQAIAAAIPNCRSLHILSLKSNEIGHEGAKAIAAALPDCRSISRLNLGNNHIGDAGAHAICRVLPKCTSLQTLKLADNKIGDGGAQAIAAAIPKCRSLHILHLNVNDIGHKGAKAIAAALPGCRSISSLNLANNHIGDAGAHAICRVLPKCTSLVNQFECLDQIGDAKAICEVLPKCTSLKYLYLTGNKIDDGGVQAVRQAWRAAGKFGDCLHL